MATQNGSWLSRNWRDLIKAVLIIAMVVFAVLGWHFSDAADTPFWWNTWSILAGACLVSLIVGWAILWNKDKHGKV